MKKLVMGSKKVFVAFMLVAMMVCTMASLVQAGYHITKSGSRGRNADEVNGKIISEWVQN